MKSISRNWLRLPPQALDLLTDCRGIAATEFAVIVPIMLVMFFGTVEFSSGVAVDRKVTLVARTLSDLLSQSLPTAPNSTSATVDDTSLQNVFTASIAIVNPYTAAPVKAQLTEIYVDSNQVAKVQWSKAATIGTNATQATLAPSSRNAGDIISVPTTLLTRQTYLLFSEVSYLYTPAVGYVMGMSGVTLTDVSYTRPRQVVCVTYNNIPAGCPTP
jgi:Flp pilus assembly protein TadG